jgi:predicted transcriptional regulator
MLKTSIFTYSNLSSMATEEWDTLSEYHKNMINEGLAQAEAGLGEPVADVIKRLREKYGLTDQRGGDDIDPEEQKEIEEGLRQADRGEVTPHEEVMSKYQKWRKNNSDL